MFTSPCAVDCWSGIICRRFAWCTLNSNIPTLEGPCENPTLIRQNHTHSRALLTLVIKIANTTWYDMPWCLERGSWLPIVIYLVMLPLWILTWKITDVPGTEVDSHPGYHGAQWCELLWLWSRYHVQHPTVVGSQLSRRTAAGSQVYTCRTVAGRHRWTQCLPTYNAWDG